MRKYIKILFLLLVPILGMAQQQYPDSLKKVLKNANADSTRYSALNGIGEYYVEINGDSALYYLDRAFTVAKKNGRAMNEAVTLARKGYVLTHKAKYPEAFACFQQALKLAEDYSNAVWNPNMGWLNMQRRNKIG